MDKQTNILSNTQNLIPVNTRTIGAPEGIYILYLEDYVHTFFKKILSDKDQQGMPMVVKNKNQEYQQEYQIEGPPQPNIALYGRYIEENGRYRIVVSGAAVLDGGNEKIQQLNNTYFPSCTYIGSAKVSFNKDAKLQLELTLNSTKVVLDDFYIYYDQNEEMQNYLVEWNTVPLSSTEHEAYARSTVNDAARLSRITQAYNREEAKVSFMWNIMNILCLGFVVCVMAYGIISVNNYNKMQSMQTNIDYCLAFIAENTSFNLNAPRTSADQDTDTGKDKVQAVPTMQQSVQIEQEIQEMSQTDTEQQSVQETTQSITDTQSVQDLSQAQPATDLQPVSDEQAAQEETEPAQQNVQAETPQYYIVRKGDTLRTICYDIYGDYSRVDEVCQWNNIADPNNILYGQKLLLP